MVKHNNVIPNGHFKKHWQNYVKTWFNQPARKQRRRIGELFAPSPLLAFQYVACLNSRLSRLIISLSCPANCNTLSISSTINLCKC